MAGKDITQLASYRIISGLDSKTVYSKELVVTKQSENMCYTFFSKRHRALVTSSIELTEV